MSSCGIYNKYERPEVNATGLVRDVTSNTDTLAVADTTSFGNLPWRSVFTDPQLQALIEQGLAKNTDLLNAALNVKMVEAQAHGCQGGVCAFVHVLSAGNNLFMGRKQGCQDLFFACQRKAGALTFLAICLTRNAARRWLFWLQKTISWW